MPHIEKRRELYYATLKVPEALRPAIGKAKLIQSLGTSDKRQAERLAVPVVARWKAIFDRERGQGDAVVNEALRWREYFAEVSNDAEHEALADLLVSKAEQLEEQAGEKVGIKFADIAMGRKTPSTTHRATWEASIGELKQKTQDQMKRDVDRVLARFQMIEDATPRAVREWVDSLQAKGETAVTVNRLLGSARSYWRHLKERHAIAEDVQPFKLTVKVPKAARKNLRPFDPKDVPSLWKAAEDRGDLVLAHLIQLGAYTGARIGELCGLKLSEVSDKAFSIEDAKTPAGVREVPIHSALAASVAWLRHKAAEEGSAYLVPGDFENKYAARGDALGKRFGRLKTALGFSESFNFHSLRKTVATLLENAGVNENLAADIVGHEKPRITYRVRVTMGSVPGHIRCAISQARA
jgi:integrase